MNDSSAPEQTSQVTEAVNNFFSSFLEFVRWSVVSSSISFNSRTSLLSKDVSLRVHGSNNELIHSNKNYLARNSVNSLASRLPVRQNVVSHDLHLFFVRSVGHRFIGVGGAEELQRFDSASAHGIF